jgi:hypothetical protein
MRLDDTALIMPDIKVVLSSRVLAGGSYNCLQRVGVVYLDGSEYRGQRPNTLRVLRNSGTMGGAFLWSGSRTVPTVKPGTQGMKRIQVPATRRKVFNQIKHLTISKCPFANLPETERGRRGQGLTAEKMRECVWLKPEAIGQVEFL